MNLLVSLRYLVELERHRHFGRAAEAAHITQPALSNAVRALEEEFAVAIVKRGRAFVGFTDEGEKVLTTARRMLQERELLQQELQSSASQPRGNLVIGAVPSVIPVAARFAATLNTRHPEISPVVRSMSSVEIEMGIENLTLDIGLGYINRAHEPGIKLAAHAQYSEHYFLLRRAKKSTHGALTFGAPISWKQASTHPMCLLTTDMFNRTIVDAAFAEAGVKCVPVIETNSMLAVALTVQASSVCAIVPGALVGAVRSNGEFEALPLIEPEIRTPIGFMSRATGVFASRTLNAALELARDEAWLTAIAQHAGLLKP